MNRLRQWAPWLGAIAGLVTILALAGQQWFAVRDDQVLNAQWLELDRGWNAEQIQLLHDIRAEHAEMEIEFLTAIAAIGADLNFRLGVHQGEHNRMECK